MGFKIPNFAKQMSGSPFAMKSPLKVDRGSQNSSSSEKPKGPDWSKAPKNNTQARRDWYTKNKLKQDETTKVKSDTDTKPSTASKPSETKDDKPKTKTRKQMRAEKRVGKLKKKQEKKGALTPGQQKRLYRNKSKAKGEKVQEKDKTNVGKAIKKGVDKVKDVVKKKKDDNSMSDADRAAKRKASGKYNADGSPKSAEERNSALARRDQSKKDSAAKKIDSGEISTGKKTREEFNKM